MNVNIDFIPKSVKLFRWQPAFGGLVFAVIFLCLSLTPSLLPRTWAVQGIVTGISMSIGYGIGLVVSATYRWLAEHEFSKKIKVIVWRAVIVISPILILAFMLLGRFWQNDVRHAVGAEYIDGLYMSLVLIVAAVIFVILISCAKFAVFVARRFKRLFHKKLPLRLAILLGIFISTVIVYLIVSDVFINNFLKVADGYYGRRDHTAPERIDRPDSVERSGSPSSLIPWEEIGYQGRGFVGSGPSPADLEYFNHKTAKMPIRVYAGLASAKTADERAKLVVDELKRTKAFDRKVLVVATPTGTGWLDPKAVDALEFMYNGDTAIATQQYSYLPSWISFLVDKERAREAGRAVYDAVIDEYNKLPEEKRPKLLVYGLSLGSFGSQAAFSGVNDISRSVNGALYVGTPNDTELWRNVTNNRDAGSPEWQPNYRGGQKARFASNRQDLIDKSEAWSGTRILFQQHASDPVVWFSFDLPFHEPDWLKEPRGQGVSEATRWYPVISFVQIGLDQALAGSAPVGYGHYYIDTTTYAWASVLPPQGWTLEKSDKLQQHINNSFDSKTSSYNL